MKSYLLRRLLLMVPTLLGITLVVFTLIQLVPGGPVEEAIARARATAGESGGANANKALSAEEIESIRTYYGFDKPAYQRYFLWLGKVVQGDLGTSWAYEEPVLDVIVQRFPVSLFFGVTSFFLSYLICIPLGAWKAVHNGTKGDTATSVAIFSGYVMPGYALGILLLIFLAGGTFLDWFPLGGMVSDEWESLGTGAKIVDFLHHMVLPLTCYMVGEFAFLTLLMKNSLLEELRKDYMKAALARGSSFGRALWKHAMRNALIPLATRLGEIFTVMFAGALLIERVFDIDGMGLLYWNAMTGRDYNVVMGIILLSSLMAMLGRLFSDLLYAWIDPRISYR
jgi:microcin C transport system permease protein